VILTSNEMTLIIKSPLLVGLRLLKKKMPTKKRKKELHKKVSEV
jgi:hypothetical protein